MQSHAVAVVCLSIFTALILAFLYWRYIWFFRNPQRRSPQGENFVSPADGTVVYVKNVAPHEEVFSIKQGVSARIQDIVPEDLFSQKILVGIFMSPFNVHYNRAPLSGRVEFVHRYPAKGPNAHMGPMHWRTLLKRPPFYRGSLHIVQNERTVTRMRCRFKGISLPCYIVQIAGRNVKGIKSYVHDGMDVEKGDIFGMIRIGSQVDLVVPWMDGMNVRVKPGDRVRAGQTVIID